MCYNVDTGKKKNPTQKQKQKREVNKNDTTRNERTL